MNVRVALLQIASQHTKSGQRGVAGCPGIPGQIKSVWVAGSPRNTQFRQAGIFARQGVHLDRSTLAKWLGRVAHELTPVYECLKADLRQSTKLFMDETTAPVLDRGRGKPKTGYFWALARDDRLRDDRP